MAPTREQLKHWQREAAPGDGLAGAFDRGAWAAAGQREPWLFDWPRALLFVGVTLALLVGMVILDVSEPTVLVGGGLGVALLTLRAYQLHRRYLRRRDRPGV